MRIDWSTLALQTINALVLIWLLARFLFRPVAGIIAERQKAAQTLIADAEAAKRAAVLERDTAVRETQQLVAARGDAMKAVAADAAAEKAALLAVAQADADRLRAAADAEAEAARVEQDKLVAVRATQLAVDIAAKLLAKLPENVRVSGFIDGLADAIAQLPEPVRAQLGANGVALTLAAPHALSPQELEHCRTVLAACLNRAVSLEVEVDPQLIAGLELRAAHAVVRNNFGADLAQIRAALLGSEHVPS
ncbi:ATP synthase F0 subunit B [Paraburkholderia phytofirmans OLGA172]|uniref:ATP synthase F0 subunit B n=1 Tax=Paraburkholderia phytofirmans OLGA172 TaxID=1417228 RepID=A0A160FKD0_9BURK|nr:F0F1 ATP synthase subunit delta [Paraburkholderia phytofirmans]ANB72704.1 ATP synthase F0 subunit B [Paraburkholderia phytofirmans OLGA172]